jgi:hypothetical protein
MSEFIPQLLTLSLLMILSIAGIGTLFQLSHSPKKKEESSDPLFTTYEEFMKVVDFMLSFGVIDITQYNELIRKASSYLK